MAKKRTRRKKHRRDGMMRQNLKRRRRSMSIRTRLTSSAGGGKEVRKKNKKLTQRQPIKSKLSSKLSSYILDPLTAKMMADGANAMTLTEHKIYSRDNQKMQDARDTALTGDFYYPSRIKGVHR